MIHLVRRKGQRTYYASDLNDAVKFVELFGGVFFRKGRSPLWAIFI